MNNIIRISEPTGRVLSVDVDGLRGVTTYTIKEQFDEIRVMDNGFEYATLGHRLIDEFSMTWDEIEEEEKEVGQSMKEQIYEAYGIA